MHCRFTFRCLLLVIAMYLRTRVFPILLSSRDKGRIYLCHFSQNLCCLVREFGTVNCISKYLPTDSTFNSPDSCSTAICVASRYSILATLFCGCALRRILGSPKYTVSPFVAFVAKGGILSPGPSHGECVYGPFCGSLPAVYRFIPKFHPLPHFP